METQQDHSEETEDRPDEGTAALDTDNPTPPEDAGEQGAGMATGGDEGLTEGTEPGEGNDVHDSERP